jgi:hypothetical protein
MNANELINASLRKTDTIKNKINGLL